MNPFVQLGHTVHAFEPHPPNFRLLACSAFSNSFDPSLVRIYNDGLTSDPSRRRGCIAVPEVDNFGNAVVTSLPASGTCPPKTTSVNLTTLDSFYLSPAGLNGAQPDLLKMDVQGMEHAVLLGANRLFSMAPPSFLFFEYEPESIRKQGGDPLEFLRRLRSYGYSKGYVMPGSGADEKWRMKNWIGAEEDLAAGKLGSGVDLVAVHERMGESGDLFASLRKREDIKARSSSFNGGPNYAEGVE